MLQGPPARRPNSLKPTLGRPVEGTRRTPAPNSHMAVFSRRAARRPLRREGGQAPVEYARSQSPFPPPLIEPPAKHVLSLWERVARRAG